MRLNRGGLIGCGIYAGIFLLLIGLEFIADPKGVVVLGQFAVFPAGMLFAFSGLYEIIPHNSWMSSGYFALALSLVIAYFIGCALSAIVSLLRRLFVRQPPAPVGDDPPGWRPR